MPIQFKNLRSMHTLCLGGAEESSWLPQKYPATRRINNVNWALNVFHSEDLLPNSRQCSSKITLMRRSEAYLLCISSREMNENNVLILKSFRMSQNLQANNNSVTNSLKKTIDKCNPTKKHLGRHTELCITNQFTKVKPSSNPGWMRQQYTTKP